MMILPLPYFVYFLVSQNQSRKLDTCENATSKETGFCLPEEFCTGTAKGNNIGLCESQDPTEICCRIVHTFNGTTNYPKIFTIIKIPLPVGDGIEKQIRTAPDANSSVVHPAIRRFVDRHIVDKKRRIAEIHGIVFPYSPRMSNASQEAGMVSNEGITDPANSGSTHRRKKSMNIEAIHIEKSSLENYSIDEIETAMKDLMHDIRKSVETDKTYDMREPVEIDPTHDRRKLMNTDLDSMGKLMNTDLTHNIRKPVKVDPTHDMRRAVQSDESHDLRWPVKEEETHDLRNPSYEVEMDMFRRYIITEMVRFINAYKDIQALSNILKSNTYSSVHITEDYIKCVTNYSKINVNLGDSTPLQHGSPDFEWNFVDISRNATIACGHPYNRQNMQTNGSKNEWPWMVSLQEYFHHRYWHKCSASLLNSLWVITAAHCVDHEEKEDLLLRLGSKGTESIPELTVDRFLERIVIHPMYTRATLEHDVALIRMDSPVQFRPNISPICLLSKVDQVDNSSTVSLGWGFMRIEETVVHSLLELPVTLLNNSECDDEWKRELFGNNFICATIEEPYTFCDGDSGGPLAILNNKGKWSMLGIVSWSHTCSAPSSKQPRAYTRISEYAKWIEGMMMCFEKLILTTEK